MMKMMCAAPAAVRDEMRGDTPEPVPVWPREELQAIAARLSVLAAGVAEDPLASAAATPGGREAVEAILAAHRRRAILFGEGLFEEPGWDLLLALYVAHLEGVGLEPQALYEASGVAPSAALRWLDLLVDAGLIVRTSDPQHRRRLRIALTGKAAERMREYLGGAVDAAAL